MPQKEVPRLGREGWEARRSADLLEMRERRKISSLVTEQLGTAVQMAPHRVVRVTTHMDHDVELPRELEDRATLSVSHPQVPLPS